MCQGFDDGFRLVLAVAEALRDEFGVEIDAHPGGETIEAGSINRVFCAIVRTIVANVATGSEDQATIVRDLLRQAALRRLTELGIQSDQAEVLVFSEPTLGDHWPAYLSLAPASVIEDLLHH
jgi:hypothetical protein